MKNKIDIVYSSADRTQIRKLNNIVALVIPLFVFVEINMIGSLFAPEVILFLLLPFLMVEKGREILQPKTKTLLILGAVWLCSQIVSDFYHLSKFADYSRGWAKIFFFLSNFMAFYLLLDDRTDRALILMIGIGLGQIFDFIISPSVLALDYPWKFGIGEGVTLLMILSTAHRSVASKPLIVFVVLAIAVLSNLFMGYRSLSGICFLVLIIICLVKILKIDRKIRIKLTTRKFIIATTIIVAASALFLESYEYLASHGMLGEVEKLKYETQATGRYGILLGGRYEIIASIAAIKDSPVMGHGSWAKDQRYSALLAETLELLGYGPQENYNTLIPSHSYLFGAWVEAGMLGAVFWIWVLVFLVKELIAVANAENANKIVLLYIIVKLCWDILFSPLGSVGRLYSSFYLAFLAKNNRQRYSEMTPGRV